MDFALFLLVNAVLFTRPAEVVESLQALPIYFVLMAPCLAISIPSVLNSLTSRSVYSHPSFQCAFAFCVCAMMSIFVNAPPGEAADEAIELFKTFLYFVLFVALVDRASRLRLVMISLTLYGMLTTAIGLIHFYHLYRFSTLKPVFSNVYDPATGMETPVERLQFTGILQDPNEACVYLGILAVYALHGVMDKAAGIWRLLWIFPLGLFLFAIGNTQSRGGLLALLIGFVFYWIYAYGGRKALVYCLIGFPLIFVAFAGRQTEFAGASTSSTRIGLWSDWMDDFRANPVLGVGPKVIGAAPDPLAEGGVRIVELRHLAHNSFLQGFADTGFVGGMYFLGAFLFAFASLNTFAFNRVWIVDDELRRLHPCIVGATAVYAAGLMTLTLNYILTTFFVLAVPIAYANMTVSVPPARRVQLDPESMVKVLVASVLFLAFIYVVIRVFR